MKRGKGSERCPAQGALLPSLGAGSPVLLTGLWPEWRPTGPGSVTLQAMAGVKAEGTRLYLFTWDHVLVNIHLEMPPTEGAMFPFFHTFF